MANSIKIKRSSVAAKVPVTGDLELGELAINTYDGKLYLKKDNGTASIVTVNPGGGGSGDVVGPGSSTDNAITRFDGVTGLLIQNSTATLDDSGVVSVSGANISGLTASSAVATDGSKNLVSVANTGTGANVLATSPTLITPALGTPTALVGTNISGTASGLSIGGNAGTVTDGVYTTDTSTVTNTMLAGSIANNKLVNSAITINGSSTSLGGSISVGTVTSVTGTSPISSSGGATPDISISAAGVSTSGYLSATDWNTFNNKGSVTNLTGPITSVGNATSIASQTGTGSTFVMNTSPVLVTPNLGTPTAGVLTNCTFPTLNQDTTGTASKTNALNSATTVVNVSSAAAPTVGQILMATSGTAATWQTPAAGGVTTVGFGTTGLTPSAATGGAITVAGTLATANGGTGVTATSTGTGGVVLNTSPTLITPVLGVATATSLAVSGFVGTSAIGALVLPSGTAAQRPTGITGMARVNSATGNLEFYTGTAWVVLAGTALSVEYLVVAGGGGGAAGLNAGNSEGGGGGGAGGYLTSSSTLVAGTNYTVTIGGGGSPGSGSGSSGVAGSNSVFNVTTSTGGGRGTTANTVGGAGGSGGAGGAGTSPQAGGAGTAGQGNNGGAGANAARAGGGGGAGAVGTSGGSMGAGAGGTGGTGSTSVITGIAYAGGGGGGGYNVNSSGGSGGGGGGGSVNVNGTAGTANRGGGGGGSGYNVTGGAGGSGIVVLRYPSIYTITIGAGLSGSTGGVSGGYLTTTITAGTGTVSWA